MLKLGHQLVAKVLKPNQIEFCSRVSTRSVVSINYQGPITITDLTPDPQIAVTDLPESSVVGRYNKSKERLVSVNGIKLNIREEGEGDHNLLCLPGVLGTIEADFGKIFVKLDKSKYRLISWDPPGYGKSRPYTKSHRGDFYLRDANLLVSLMDKLHYDKFSIIGGSNGGMTGLAIAAEFPDRVTKLAMWAAQAFLDKQTLRIADFLDHIPNWSPIMLKDLYKIYDKQYVEDTIKNWTGSVREFYASGESQVLTERCPKIRCPTLVLHGEKDPLIPVSHPQYFAKHITNSTFRFIPGAGHNPHVTHTEQLLNFVEQFLLNSNESINDTNLNFTLPVAC